MKDAFYQARLTSTRQYLQRVEGVHISRNEVPTQYLTADQYAQVSSHWIVYMHLLEYESVFDARIFVQMPPPWLSHLEDATLAWSQRWASESFHEESVKHRDNRGHNPNHTFGSDSWTRLAQRLVRFSL